MSKRIAYCTFGCRLNQYDTEAIRTLVSDGCDFETVGARETADVYVVNTCSVTARADATARKAIRRINTDHPAAKIVVTGCYAQRAPGEIAALPGVALVVGAADRSRIATLIDHLDDGPPVVAVSPIAAAKSFLDVPITEMTEHSRAFVKVQEGCDEACTFCIVPQTRGASRAGHPESVLAQVRQLAAAGYVEVVLTGVHIGDYGLDLSRTQANAARADRKHSRYRGGQAVSAELNRTGVRQRRDHHPDGRVAQVRAALPHPLPERKRFGSRPDEAAVSGRRVFGPHCADQRAYPRLRIGADVICGFPGESDGDFLRTFESVETLPITYLHVFTYSARPGSEAEHFSDQVPPEVRKRRTRALKRLAAEKQRRFAHRHVGRIMEVLLEPARRGGTPRVGGWTDNYLRVDLGEGEAETRLESVEITGLGEDGLIGTRTSVRSQSGPDAAAPCNTGA